MQYALLIYGAAEGPDRPETPIDPAIATLLARPEVTGWARLHTAGSATTVRPGDRELLLTDGPFVESKEYLAGVIMIEAADLDEALALTGAFQRARTGGAIEVRPMIDGHPGDG